MKVKIEHNPVRCYFAAEADEERAGLMTYQNAQPNIMVIDHTEVEPQFENKGIGTAMIMDCVYYARKNDKKIIPQCAFARVTFARKNDIHDVLFKM